MLSYEMNGFVQWMSHDDDDMATMFSFMSEQQMQRINVTEGVV